MSCRFEIQFNWDDPEDQYVLLRMLVAIPPSKAGISSSNYSDDFLKITDKLQSRLAKQAFQEK